MIVDAVTMIITIALLWSVAEIFAITVIATKRVCCWAIQCLWRQLAARIWLRSNPTHVPN